MLKIYGYGCEGGGVYGGWYILFSIFKLYFLEHFFKSQINSEKQSLKWKKVLLVYSFVIALI